MMNKEQNFISAVVYLHNNEHSVERFFRVLFDEFNRHFEKFELIAVNAASSDGTMQRLEAMARERNLPLTVVHMSLLQSREACMNAGLDAAIGDYIFEFDSTEQNFPAEYIFEAYETALTGHDIVSVCPRRQSILSSAFYSVFNRYAVSPYALRTEAFRLVSRRAVNRVHATSSYMPYRKAAFAMSGLSCAQLEYAGKSHDVQQHRLHLAIESLLLYTNTGYRCSVMLSLSMLVVAVASVIYALVVYTMGEPVAGWTTTMLILTCCFSGLFALITVVIKYLALILELTFKNERYLIKNVEKIQN